MAYAGDIPHKKNALNNGNENSLKHHKILTAGAK